MHVGVIAARAQQDSDRRRVHCRLAQLVVDNRDIEPELSDMGRLEPAETEFDHHVADLRDVEQQ